MFELHEVDRGRGWSGTVDRISDKKALSAAKITSLLEALHEHELTSEKVCSFYRIEKQALVPLRAKLASAKVQSGPMQTAYPLLLDDAELKKLPLGEPTLIAIEGADGGTAVVYSSVRALRVRETVDPKLLSVNAAKLLATYDEVIGLKLIRHQAIDVVWVPDHSDVVELRIDFPKGTHADIIGALQKVLIASFAKRFAADPFGKPINLFPLIDKMYCTATEGRVVELAFGTTTRSLKRERMRLSADDLRTELYHVAGKSGLKTPVQPYKISIAYTVGIGSGVKSHPELSLHSTSRVADKPNPQLFDAVIRKTVGFTDYDHVRDRILHFA
jgi:hypothetical protein